MHQRWQQGGNLIGLMIGLGIFAGLMMAALPNFRLWLHSAQVRTAAESLRDGLQFARMEAVRRNSPIEFRLPNKDGAGDWEVGCPTDLQSATFCPAIIQSRLNQEGSTSALVRTATDTNFSSVAEGALPVTLVFSGMGRLEAKEEGTLPARLDVVSATTRDARRLVLVLSSGGRARLCDPAIDLEESAGGCE